MTKSLRKKTSISVIIVSWFLWLIIGAYLIHKGMEDIPWRSYRIASFSITISVLFSLYLLPPSCKWPWLFAGIALPYFGGAVITVLNWYLNFEIVLMDLENIFFICGIVMLVTIPGFLFVKVILEE